METKYNIKDEVYIIDNNKIKKSYIASIRVYTEDNSIETSYGLCFNKDEKIYKLIKYEDEIFSNTDLLVKRLLEDVK